MTGIAAALPPQPPDGKGVPGDPRREKSIFTNHIKMTKFFHTK